MISTTASVSGMMSLLSRAAARCTSRLTAVFPPTLASAPGDGVQRETDRRGHIGGRGAPAITSAPPVDCVMVLLPSLGFRPRRSRVAPGRCRESAHSADQPRVQAGWRPCAGRVKTTGGASEDDDAADHVQGAE